MLHYIFVLIIFFSIFITGKCESIYCYHGESHDSLATNISTIYCPSGKCLMFSSACNTYWATTCYNEKKPMTLMNSFQKANKYYKISSFSNRMFSICNMSACNYNKQSPFLQPILKTPISFDSLLWPKIEKEKQRNVLQNGFKFLRGILANEKFEFIGQTFNKSTNIWIKYDFSLLNTAIITYRFDFNLSESFYILRTIIKKPKKNAALSNTLISSVERRAFKYATFPGEKLTVSLKNNNGKNHEIGINSFDIPLPTDVQNLLLIQYGGNWIMSSAKIMKEKMLNNSMWIKESEFSYEMNPTFDIPKPSAFTSPFYSSKQIESIINTTLEYTFIGDKTSNSMGTTMIPLFGHIIERNFKQNEIVEYEIRDNLFPNSNLIKIQIENVQGLSDSKNSTLIFTIWKRLNSIWILSENVKKETEICKSSNTMHFYSNGFLFLCNNINVYSLSQNLNYVEFVKANYLIEGIPQNLNC